GEEVFQVVVGSSANPGLRDFAVVAEIVRGRQSHDQVSFDVNPTSRQLLADLAKFGWLFDLIAAGARIHQSGCLGCIGRGAVPAGDAREQELVKGPNIASLPEFDPLPDRVEAPVELKVGDNISTDEILPAGAQVLPLRSNIPAISRFVFTQIDADYAQRAAAA